jgi:hypothetical protein
MKHLTFEEFLQRQHAMKYHGLDDNMPDKFEAWLETLDGNDLVAYGEEYGKQLFNQLTIHEQ